MTTTLHLLPQPKHLVTLPGAFTVPGAGTIVVRGAAADEALIIGRACRSALEPLGAGAWPITAGGDTGTVEVCIDPLAIPAREGYRLQIRPAGIQIMAHDGPGAFYAAMTLRQIAQQVAKGALPGLRIDDAPDFPHRGVMLDISRDRVPTMDTLRQLIDLLATLKINQFQLYTEHTFAYRRHQTVWQAASPMTGEEILELDRYCRERFIELVPNQNAFGHWERWLKHKAYQHLADCAGGFEYPWGGRAASGSVLCPIDPGSEAILGELFDELLPNFSSRQFNVGCDETWELGQGRSKEACAARGKERVYLEFLLKIHRLVQRHGRTMQFWGDIILHRPELIAELPAGIIALEWGYEANHPFAERGRKFADAGVPFYVCPGTSAWNSLGGRTDNMKGNLVNAAATGLEHGAIGFLNTNWGDNGNWEHLPVSFAGFAYGAAVNWSLAASRDLDLPRALDLHVFRDQAGVMGDFVCRLGNLYQVAASQNSNSAVFSRLLSAPDAPPVEGRLCEGTPPMFERALAEIDGLLPRLGQVRMQRPDADLIVEEFRQTAVLMRHACRLGTERVQHAAPTTAALPAEKRRLLAAEFEPLLALYRRLWLARSRPGGLPESVARFERVLAAYRA